MSLNPDDEILQDFLIEAGEILDKLGEQLVELEQRPADLDLLNAVFRGFHTVKGGAGFLSLTALVEVCHRAEDVFNLLRQGQRSVDPDLMDTILRVVDVVKRMMDEVRSGQEPAPAETALLKQLERLLGGTPAEGASDNQPAPAAAHVSKGKLTSSSAGDKVDEEFDQIVMAAAESGKESSQQGENGNPAGDLISEEEFEALLDQLHGPKPVSDATAASAAKAESAGEGPKVSSDNITEEEFDALLDQLQGPVNSDKSGKEVKSPPKAAVAVSTPVVADTPRIESSSQPHKTASKPMESTSASPARASETGNQAAAAKEPAHAQVETTVRVDTKRLDDIMNLVGELVLVRNRLSTLRANLANEEALKAVSNLDLVTADLQTAVMKTRMQPIKKVFGRFPRVVRDLARSLNKEISLEVYGEETDLDKNLVEALADPLVHLVRNAVDHGIEMPDVRAAAGKDRVGKVVLEAKQEGDHIVITIRDDGGGINPDILRKKAVEKGLLDAETAERLDKRECFNLIFLPGFSTKTEISDVSGRGVGMDVVKTRIAQLNGAIEIDSEIGKGSVFRITLPLTLAIVPALMVLLGRQIFAIPLANVSEIVQIESIRINVVEGQKVFHARNQTLPLVDLRDRLVHNHQKQGDGGGGYVVVVRVNAQHMGCIVDQLIAQEEVVIKPLGLLLQGTRGLAGATITGDGRIALILDMSSLLSK